VIYKSYDILYKNNMFRNNDSLICIEKDLIEKNLVSNNNDKNTKSSYETNIIKKKLIIDQMRSTIFKIFKIIDNKLKITKYKSFLIMIEVLKTKKTNILKAEMIFEKFENMMINISRIYAKFQNLKFRKILLKWKNYTLFRKKYNLLKGEVEKISEKKFEKDLKNFESKLKEKENETSEIKKIIQKNNEIETGLLKTISEFEEKENNYSKGITKLKEIDLILIENNKSQNILKNINYSLINNNNRNFENNEEVKKNISDTFSNGNNGNSFIYKKEYLHKLEEKIRDKENQTIDLRKDNNTNDQKINAFMMEMSHIIQDHENNSKIIYLIYFLI